MAKDPAFLFYSSDFLTGTMTMTNEQVGAYIRLLCLQHQKGPLSKKDMQSICSAYDEDVLSKFPTNAAGQFENERLTQEIEKRRSYTESRRKNASKKKEEDSTNGEAYAKHMHKHMENEDVNTVVSSVSNQEVKENNIAFKLFWDAYDKKVGNPEKVRKKWERLTDNERTAIMLYLPAYKESQPDKAYRKNPETFLNNKSWHDEIIPKHGTDRTPPPKSSNNDKPGTSAGRTSALREW